MSAPRPVESEYLAQAERVLNKVVRGESGIDSFEFRLQVLEAVSSRIGGFDLKAFHKAFGIKSVRSCEDLLALAIPIVNEIKSLPFHHSLALSALAREVLHEHDRKSTGAYHTDFRLATRLAELTAQELTYESRAIDPACGAGILLAALTFKICGADRANVAYWLANGVCAADLSINSLRATLLSLASFTDDLEALKKMRSRWYCGDSLMATPEIWNGMAPERFDAVIGNPPWEKVKLSRHEFLKSAGTERHYGAKINDLDEESFSAKRNEVANYSKVLFARFPILGNGEPDLYVAFTDLFFELCKDGGVVAALIPGGFIRSQGTHAIRKKLIELSQSVSISVIDNRAKFFAIDSRFKFLAVKLVKAGILKNKRDPIQLLHEQGTADALEITGKTNIGRLALGTIRPDLSVPEVRNAGEWKLFSKITEAGISWEDPDYGWKPKFCREVDMTKERKKFLGVYQPNTLPVIEGRMVQSHRFGVKGYVSGSGRSAIWEGYPIGSSNLNPQFWIRACDVPRANRDRINKLRVGFCDIAGQTNERSLMATLIPKGVVCGNKVPTILFQEDDSIERLMVWLAVANSFVFDWMLRRVLTTTVNYFLMQSIPLPRLANNGLPWNKLASVSSELQKLDTDGSSQDRYDKMAKIRAEIDTEVALSYGLGLEDMELIFQDFPIIDRKQPPLPGESKSTITRDYVLATMAKRVGSKSTIWSRRVDDAKKLGALAYVPSEISDISPIELKEKNYV